MQQRANRPAHARHYQWPVSYPVGVAVNDADWSAARLGLARSGLAWLGLAWLGLARSGLARSGLARSGRVRLCGPGCRTRRALLGLARLPLGHLLASARARRGRRLGEQALQARAGQTAERAVNPAPFEHRHLKLGRRDAHPVAVGLRR